MINTKESLDLTKEISEKINNRTFHHHYYILYDIANTYPKDYHLNYVEIGCYAGGSACLMLQRKNTSVISIDIGHPIEEKIVQGNIDKLNKYKNKFTYIKGDSTLPETFGKLQSQTNSIDILFIDGDHTYDAVLKDFKQYSRLLKEGGYVVFDDYNDEKHSPEVKIAVDHITEICSNEYEIIGTIKNTYGARPSELINGNDFILRKKINEKIKLAIVMSTYKRKDGKSPFYVKRAIDSIFNQTYSEFKIFLIGDKYEQENEITEIISNYDANKIEFINLNEAVERDNYSNNKWALWSYGGVNAVNYGINIATSNGFDYICHLDHDDFWFNNHLNELAICINTFQPEWVCTKSNYTNNTILPTINSKEKYVEFLPLSEGVIHSSVCFNFKKIPLKYEDIYKKTGKIGLPADADLWQRMKTYIIENNLKSILINKITCNHIEEGYERR